MGMPILAVDYGARRTGLAIADDELRIASPLGCVGARGRAAVVEGVAEVARREGVARIVVGLPLNMDGTAGPMAEAAAALAEALRQRTGLPVDLFDERLTSHAAEGLFAGTELTKSQRKRRVDALAAMLLLQSYLHR